MSQLLLVIEWESALKWIFLIIFGLTAILTVLSIPEWIKIPEWYKKKLFTALILEVVGAIVIVFSGLNKTGDQQDIKPVIECKHQHLGERNPLKYTINEDDNLEIADDSLLLGYISKNKLRKNGIFNTIESGDGFNAAYGTIKWEKESTGWTQTESIANCKLNIQVYDSAGLKYRIRYNEKVLFPLEGSTFNFNNDNNRITHVFYEDNAYYIAGITAARLSQPKWNAHQKEEQKAAPKLKYFVQFMVIKLEPDFKMP